MGQEIELKLSFPPSSMAALKRHPIIASCTKQGRAVTLDNTYYDTDTLQLRAARIGLRTRRQGNALKQTVKCAATSQGGLSARPEWEKPYRNAFDFSDIDDSATRKQLLTHEPFLQPIFSTRFRRETLQFAPEDGIKILLMIDQGTVHAGQQEQPLCELELELVHGKAQDLLNLARQLAADLPLLPNDVSKAQRGYDLFLGHDLCATKAEISPLTAEQTPLEAFKIIAFSCIRQWQANANACLHGHPQPEFIHQLRVSQRRLRSLLRVFKPALPETFVSTWLDRLRDNANQLGNARDFDVLQQETLADIEPICAYQQALQHSLTQEVAEMAEQARNQTRDNMRSAAQGKLILDFIIDIDNLPSSVLMEAVHLPRFAALQLNRLRRKVRQCQRAATTLEPVHLHELRIALKKLRYGFEFFLPLMPAKKAAAYSKLLTQIQNKLGFFNDIDVARERLLTLAQDNPQLREASGFVLGWHAIRQRRASQTALKQLSSKVWQRSPWQTLL